jgi:hypothetical protein
LNTSQVDQLIKTIENELESEIGLLLVKNGLLWPAISQ